MSMQEEGVSGGVPSMPLGVSGDIVVGVEERPKKSSALKKWLIGFFVVLVVGGIGTGVFYLIRSFGGIEKEVVAGAIEEHRGDVQFLDDMFRMMPQGGLSVSSFFEEGTLGVIVQKMDGLKALCDVICEYDRVRSGSDEERVLFLSIRDGIKERVELYGKAIDNFSLFYDAFGSSFREKSGTYATSDGVRELIASDGAANSAVARRIATYFEGRLRITKEMQANGCGTGVTSATCATLRAEFLENSSFDQDVSVLVGIFQLEWSEVSERFLPLTAEMLEVTSSWGQKK